MSEAGAIVIAVIAIWSWIIGSRNLEEAIRANATETKRLADALEQISRRLA